MKSVTVVIVVCAGMVGGCAKKSDEISAHYVSPIQYSSYSCAQLAEEGRRISARASQAMGAQDKKASNDTVAMGVGLILFWPALFMIKGGAENTAEVARLKGEMEALEQESIRKKCGIQFRPVAPATPATSAPTAAPQPTRF